MLWLFHRITVIHPPMKKESQNRLYCRRNCQIGSGGPKGTALRQRTNICECAEHESHIHLSCAGDRRSPLQHMIDAYLILCYSIL